MVYEEAGEARAMKLLFLIIMLASWGFVRVEVEAREEVELDALRARKDFVGVTKMERDAVRARNDFAGDT